MSPLADQVAAATAGIIATLSTGGVSAWESLQDVDPPGVLIRAPGLAFRFGGCNRMEITAWVIGPDLPRAQAMPVLMDTLSKTGDALGWPFAGAEPVDVSAPTGGLLPAYEISWTPTL
jgi:hypothetical protein